jgi:hypothetical protein
MIGTGFSSIKQRRGFAPFHYFCIEARCPIAAAADPALRPG